MQTHRLQMGQVCLSIVLVASLCACGGASFQRAKGAKRYRPLPKSFKVTSVATTDGLQTPIEVLGQLSITTKSDESEPKADNAQKTLAEAAARVGCDAVVGATVQTTSKKMKRRVRRKDAAGRSVVQVEEVTRYAHLWSAQCVRTAKAPKRPVRRRRRVRTRRVAPSTQSAPKAAATPTRPAPQTRPRRSRQTQVAPTPAPAPSPAVSAVATEVARVVLGISRAFQRSDSKTLCKYFDQERVYFDLRSRDPAFNFTKDLSGSKACASLDSGRLSTYLQEFGPAEVHSNPAILIPSLFRVHGGAYLELSADERVEHRKRLQALRAGKQQIACDMYWVVAADNLFTVHVECDGVRSYELFLRRDGKDDFKLMRLTHKR